MCVVLCVFSLRKLPGQFYAVSYISYYCNEWGILQDFDKQNIDFIFNFVNHKKKETNPTRRNPGHYFYFNLIIFYEDRFVEN